MKKRQAPSMMDNKTRDGHPRCGIFSRGISYLRCELESGHKGKHSGTNDNGTIKTWGWEPSYYESNQ